MNDSAFKTLVHRRFRVRNSWHNLRRFAPLRITDTRYASDHTPVRQRNGTVDLARFIGAIAIIWFHRPLPGASTALAALHLFIVLQVMFGVTRLMGPQARRLLVPWLF